MAGLERRGSLAATRGSDGRRRIGPRPQPVKSSNQTIRSGVGGGCCCYCCCCCVGEREGWGREGGRESIFVCAQKLRASLPGCSRRHVNIQRRGSPVPKTEVTRSSVASVVIGFFCAFFTPSSASSPFLSGLLECFLRACICLVRITNRPSAAAPPPPYPCVGSLDAVQVTGSAHLPHTDSLPSARRHLSFQRDAVTQNNERVRGRVRVLALSVRDCLDLGSLQLPALLRGVLGAGGGGVT